jgi:hypothetical protein
MSSGAIAEVESIPNGSRHPNWLGDRHDCAAPKARPGPDPHARADSRRHTLLACGIATYVTMRSAFQSLEVAQYSY